MTEKPQESAKCTCPDTWDCPYCAYSCEYCVDAREEVKALEGYRRKRVSIAQSTEIARAIREAFQSEEK